MGGAASWVKQLAALYPFHCALPKDHDAACQKAKRSRAKLLKSSGQDDLMAK
jgi:hypothetical protein